MLFKIGTHVYIQHYYKACFLLIILKLQILDTIKVDTVNKNVCEIVSEILTL